MSDFKEFLLIIITASVVSGVFYMAYIKIEVEKISTLLENKK